MSMLTLPMNVSLSASAAYTKGEGVEDIATIEVLDDSVYSAGLDSLQLMDISPDTLDEVVFNDGYTGGFGFKIENYFISYSIFLSRFWNV